MTVMDRSRNVRSPSAAAPGAFLVLLPDAPRFTIVAASDAYLRTTLMERHHTIGRGLFEVLPGNPADPTAPGIRHLSASLLRVLDSNSLDTIAIQKDDLRRR